MSPKPDPEDPKTEAPEQRDGETLLDFALRHFEVITPYDDGDYGYDEQGDGLYDDLADHDDDDHDHDDDDPADDGSLHP